VRTRAGSLEQLQRDGQLLTKVGALPVVVFWDEGRPWAIEDRCPHMGFPLHRGTVESGLVTCHWHHARFDLVTGCTLDPFADDARGFGVSIDGDALPFRQARDTGAFQHRSVHKDIFAAPIRADKAKSLGGVVPLDRAGVLDGGSASSRMQRSLRWPASRWLLRRGAAVEAQDFRYLRALGPGTGANLEGRTRRYAAVAAALDHTHMQEGIPRPIGQLYEAEPFVGIVPFNHGSDRRTGGRFKPLGAKARC